MLKRIAIVAFFTGSGQLLSVFVLKFLSQHSEISQLRAIAEIDSLVFFIMNVIALGLQSAAMRNLALSPNWEQEYYDAQSARITLGILLTAAAAFAVFNNYYLLFLIAPVLAWSGDYAMYARGYPVAGSIIAFIRLAVPFLSLLAAAYYFPSMLGWVYIVALTAVYIVTNAYISYFLKTSQFFRPSFKKLHLYVSSLPLGIVAVSLYFLGLGLVLIIPYLYPPEVVAVAFIGLKFYIIYKGVLRILHQAFLKEMQSETISLRVDQLSIIAGITLLGSAAIFSESFITFFFGKKYLPDASFFILLGIDAFIYSLFLSFATRALFLKADKKYTIITAIAAIATIISMIVLSRFINTAASIAISLGIGEITWMMGLINLSGSKKQVADRLVFIASILPPLLVPVTIRCLAGDYLIYYFISFGLLTILILLLHYRKFKTLSIQ
jgi:hypothetical protein